MGGMIYGKCNFTSDLVAGRIDAFILALGLIFAYTQRASNFSGNRRTGTGKLSEAAQEV